MLLGLVIPLWTAMRAVAHTFRVCADTVRDGTRHSADEVPLVDEVASPHNCPGHTAAGYRSQRDGDLLRSTLRSVIADESGVQEVRAESGTLLRFRTDHVLWGAAATAI